MISSRGGKQAIREPVTVVTGPPGPTGPQGPPGAGGSSGPPYATGAPSGGADRDLAIRTDDSNASQGIWQKQGAGYVRVAPTVKHHDQHEPGGTDPMAVDAVAATGSLRTLGSGAQQAVSGTDSRLSDQRVPTNGSVTPSKLDPSVFGTGSTQATVGNDSRLPTAGQKNALAGTAGTPGTTNPYVTDSDSRLIAGTPGPHHATHEPGGSDAMAVDAAAATGSLRTLGSGAAQAAAGNDARLSDQRVPTDASVTAAKLAAALKPSGSAATTDEAVRALGTTAGTAAAGNDSRITGAEQTANKGAASGYASLDGSSRVVQNPKLHASTHQPGGADAMAVDAAAATGSLRTLGTGAAQAAAGNDSRITGAEQTANRGAASGYPSLDSGSRVVQSPKLHAADHQPGGADAMAVDAAAGTGSLRTIGKTALKAADGADTEYAFSQWKDIWRDNSNLPPGQVAATFLYYQSNTIALAGAASALAAFKLDPAWYSGGAGRTVKARVIVTIHTNSVAPGCNLTFTLAPVATWTNNTTARPAVATLGAALSTVTFTAPAASSNLDSVGGGGTLLADNYVVTLANSGTTAANSQVEIIVALQVQQV